MTSVLAMTDQRNRKGVAELLEIVTRFSNRHKKARHLPGLGI